MTETQNPKEWFDQFPPNPAMDGHEQWCARHRGPCPTYGANGMGAAVEVMQLFAEEVLIPAGLTPEGSTAEQKNQKLRETGKLCCWLGDERMYKIWGHWPPIKPVTDE